MKQVTYLIVTFVVLFQLYATTSAAPQNQSPSRRNGMQSTVTMNEIHPHLHGDKFTVGLYETEGKTYVLVKNFLQTISSYFHVDLKEDNTVVVLQDQYGSEKQIYTERVLTRKNQERLKARDARHHQPVQPMMPHSPPPMMPHSRSPMMPHSPQPMMPYAAPAPSMMPHYPSSPTPMRPSSSPSAARRSSDVSAEEENETVEENNERNESMRLSNGRSN